MLRYAIDVIKDRIANGLIVNVNDTLFYILDSESFSILLPEYESCVLEYISLNLSEDSVFIDVGAHIGKYAIQIGKVVGKSGLVIAVEPHPRNYEILVENVKLNRLKNIIALNVAAWSSKCKLKLFTVLLVAFIVL